jgi:hypothetical protein
MQPFAILEGIATGKINLDIILASQDESPEDFEQSEKELVTDYERPF